MPDIFQLGTPRHTAVAAIASPFERFGYLDNPFPEPVRGLMAGAFYHGHMEKELEQIDRWLRDIQVGASDRSRKLTPSPLAIRGSLGVGKTLLLHKLELGLEQRPRCEVVRKALTEGGQTKLLLANLLLGSLPQGRQKLAIVRPSGLQMLDQMLLVAHTDSAVREAINGLGVESPIRPALQVILDTSDQRLEGDYRNWLARWLQRGGTTPTQRAKIHLAGPLEGEGQAIRAIADLLTIARAANLLDVWFVFLDQLEDLWAKDKISPGRRARFLTDLRLLIDLAAEGAPIAVLIAWNTVERPDDEPLAREYGALWRRLSNRVDLPGLQGGDLWPFAQEYLRVAPRVDPSAPPRAELSNLLHGALPILEQRLATDREASLGPQRFATYRVLKHWREVAEKITRAR